MKNGNTSKNDLAKTFFIILIGSFFLLSQFANSNNNINSVQRPSYEKPVYSTASHGYGYKASYGSAYYVPGNARGGSAAGQYAAGYGNNGYSPFLMPSYSYNPISGYRGNYDSHIRVSNALDYAYLKNPSLLAPQGMNNHQRYVKGLYPQRFYY